MNLSKQIYPIFQVSHLYGNLFGTFRLGLLPSKFQNSLGSNSTKLVSIIKWSTSPSTFTAQSCLHLSHHLPSPSLLSSCFLWAHSGHFRRLWHSSSIDLFPLSSPAMWRRVKLLQLLVSSPSISLKLVH
jgi:hypothetical protein